MIGIVIAAIIVFALLFLWLSERIFERTNYYKRFYGQNKKLKGNQKVDYVNTGSTFASFGIDYDSVKVSGLNLALCPQSIEYDFKMLKHFERRYNPGAIVFIVISDLAFAKERYDEKQYYEKYYSIMRMDEVEHPNVLKTVRAKCFPILYSWKNFLRFYKDVSPDNDYKLCVNENDREYIEAEAFVRGQSWMQEFGITSLNDKNQAKGFKAPFSFNVKTVGEMISWCKERGFKPVIINLPVTAELKDLFSKEFLDAFYYDQINAILNTYKVSFIDLQQNPKLSDYLLYIDSCRLNKVGREVVTKLLIDESRKV